MDILLNPLTTLALVSCYMHCGPGFVTFFEQCTRKQLSIIAPKKTTTTTTDCDTSEHEKNRRRKTIVNKHNRKHRVLTIRSAVSMVLCMCHCVSDFGTKKSNNNMYSILNTVIDYGFWSAVQLSHRCLSSERADSNARRRQH